MGAIDTLVNHEFIEALPHRQAARGEVGLHAVREAIYASLFVALAWLEWNGAFAAFIGALLAAEVAVTATDEFIENRIRVLPQNERVLHVFLTLNFGAIIALLIPVLLDWGAQATSLQKVDHGGTSWALSVLAMMSVAWSVRDLLAFRRLAA
ncbi:MAG TPA: hypothetical protein VJT77_00625 [Burkholderiales bacterium]|nr:hypothetical protein [Burkholderiales bacterium]